MALFEMLHGLGGLLGLGATLALFGPWTDKHWELTAAMWLGAIVAIGSGVVISLSYVGTGAQILTPMLLVKVVLSVALLGLMYSTLVGSEAEEVTEQRTQILAIGGLWVLLLAAGFVVVM